MSCGLGAQVSGWVYLASYALAHLTKGSTEIRVSKKLCKYVHKWPCLDKNFAKFHSAISGHYRTNMPQFNISLGFRLSDSLKIDQFIPTLYEVQA